MSLTAIELRKLLSYDLTTGVFVWRDRPDAAQWTSAFGGTFAGCSNDKGYRTIAISGRTYKAHRLAWLYVYGEWPSSMIDHIDGDRGNNSIDNLRVATPSQNAANKDSRLGPSGARGVSKVGDRWRAVIYFEGKKTHLGMFATRDDACRAYGDAAKKLHGEFARAPSLFKEARDGP